MALVLGLLACLGLWWFLRNRGRLAPSVTSVLPRRAGAWSALLLAALLLVRGQFGPALVLGLAGVWLLEGPERLGRRLRDLVGRRSANMRRRSAVIELEIRPDGSPGEGVVLAGPLAGERLEALAPAALLDLLALCRAQDPEGARLLEAYLDRWHPGWRVDAERDGDARPRRPPDPGAMTQEEAYQILGLQSGATPEEVRAAHRALMKRLHPDQGGSAERAARVNAARDRLLNRHR
ncbi:DnaJ domain-containing protein [Methylobacterium nigriterrae]|uniref:DnaJ domain-containing protein n=1 Tax=Methylobacterium nigriterrae TaxID=3127512 RepID=UPI003013B2AD